MTVNKSIKYQRLGSPAAAFARNIFLAQKAKKIAETETRKFEWEITQIVQEIQEAVDHDERQELDLSSQSVGHTRSELTCVIGTSNVFLNNH